MSDMALVRYVVSCGVLTLPILVWNVALTRCLPPALAGPEFSRDIPRLVTYGENTLRSAVMVLPFLMPLELVTAGQRRGVRLFVIGMIVYFLLWVPLMVAPHSAWSTHWLGFVAPAYTPLLWLIGLGLTGRRFYGPWHINPSLAYVVLACAFVAVHVAHTHLVYARTHADPDSGGSVLHSPP